MGSGADPIVVWREAPWRVPDVVLNLSRSGFRLEGRMDDGAVAGEAGRLDKLIVPLHGELFAGLVDKRLDEGVEIAGVKLDAVAASRPGTLRWPTIFTPLCSATSPGWAASQLPPRSTARSTMTDPGFMDSTMARETSLGAGRPGMSA